MNQELIEIIKKNHPFTEKQIKTVLELLEDKNTVPFIARYRKELTGGLDEVEIKQIENEYTYALNLHNRKEEVIRLIDEQGLLTEDLKNDILKQTKLQRIEDLYRPFKKKKKTRATEAKRKGLEPLAKWILEGTSNIDLVEEASKYITEEVTSHEAAIKGAQDIIAEMISDEPKYRKYILNSVERQGKLVTEKKKKAEDEKNIFEMYYTYEEPIKKIVPHRVLAINRGESEGILKVGFEIDTASLESYLTTQFVKKEHKHIEVIKEAIQDSLKRLILPSIEREIRSELTQKAEEHAIEIFSENLKNLLLQAPLKGKKILGLDPAYRTGCKLAVINEYGSFVDKNVIYPHPPVSKTDQAEKIFVDMIKKHNIELVAIGNGTASRESEQFVAEMIKKHDLPCQFVIVNEAGASVYSASDIAREEFPDFKVEERSAVSIGRRVQDPLSELVKIDPKSIGVGQYQHDVNQKALSETLKFVVETAVNQVGVDVNTASPSLLSYVSGLSNTVANNIIKFREEKGVITHHSEIAKVPRLGNKTFEQSIGFLRILDGTEPLDKTAIHPESYEAAYALIQYVGLQKEDIGSDILKEKLNKLDIQDTSETLNIGIPTLEDIIASLIAPLRDPRDEFETPILKSDVLSMEDLKPNMALSGTVRNVVDFGAFVDIGVKQDGLVHISKLSKGYVKHPMNIVSVGDIVDVWVLDVNQEKQKVSLTMIDPNGQ
ncbi:RNA-binding transcriptional accessory protein [Mammaliicoccus sciuri]|uniref:RNA-binding transcriptional accessory protein n=2 Tax=Mammaliicoccus sciuri TaxID=1296 RepID=A0A7T4U3T0_MAMSC|nr:Tex family protein [Mammaliicoccus sciuri]MCD8837081.1 RNA-binding transcriptional accessory protein [Mammaliicoccus sciuri]MCJ0940962.1 RNA-binding transcriptional accessory protein [Mammaliicoccus sciuri]MCJ0965847.1 RNA-binding transcriptional accessory protein [Mammaliicoccus sciuri]MCJ1749228.1 RNA-binding transcriptional accessory protein [Mammaliicoccus sciuri]MEB6228343.1 RNA-binding transcriptional accessory protein [Mammaliicoccus sciuri]